MGFLQDRTIQNSKRTGSNFSKPPPTLYPPSSLVSPPTRPPDRSSTARVERHKCSLQARSLSLQGWGLIDLPLRATFSPPHPLADTYHPPYPPIASQSISRDVPLARAGPPILSSPTLKREGRWSLPARIEGPPLYRGASASRKDCLPSPFFSPSSPTSLDEGGLVDPQLRASNEHILIVRVPRARGRPGHPHFLLLANASSPSAPVRGFQSRL